MSLDLSLKGFLSSSRRPLKHVLSALKERLARQVVKCIRIGAVRSNEYGRLVKLLAEALIA